MSESEKVNESENVKQKISSNLEKAKTEGQLRSEKIREIVQEAVSQTTSELKAGSSEIRAVVKDAVSAVVESLSDKGGEVKEEVTASIEGAIEAISRARRQAIYKTQAEVKQLQQKIDTEEQELQAEIETTLGDIADSSQDKSEQVKASINSAVETVKNSDEVTLMKKRYAQLKAQLAIVQANLSARYGEQYEQVKDYLDEAKVWYDQAKDEPEIVTEKVTETRKSFEQKLGEAGTAIAQKEQQIKYRLKELWDSISESFNRSKPVDSPKALEGETPKALEEDQSV